MGNAPRKPSASDVSDDEWAFVTNYLESHQQHDVLEIYNPLRWMVRTGAQWRALPHDQPGGREATTIAGCTRIGGQCRFVQ